MATAALARAWGERSFCWPKARTHEPAAGAPTQKAAPSRIKARRLHVSRWSLPEATCILLHNSPQRQSNYGIIVPADAADWSTARPWRRRVGDAGRRDWHWHWACRGIQRPKL